MLAASPQMTKARASSWTEPRAFSAAARMRTPTHRLYARDARRCPVLHGSCMVVSDEADRQSHRLYQCAACGQTVHICRACDRGNRYCAGICAPLRRRESLRRSAARYQCTRRGAARHAARQSALRARQIQIVTHQGSPAVAPAVQLPADAIEVTEGLEDAHATHKETGSGVPKVGAALAISANTWLACGLCRRRLTPWIRMGPLRRNR